MLPSRGLRPAQLKLTASRSPLASRPCPSRKFSSLPQTARLSASCRASPLQSARWRTGATRNPNVVFTASTVRNGSWYAPWSWGKSSTPSGSATDSAVDQVPIAEFSSSAASKVVEPAVTTATPEIAPAGIDKAPVVNSTTDSVSPIVDSAPSALDGKTMDDLLSLEPTKNVLDPTALIDHPGQLYEMGLDYGWGMTTMFEKLVEQIYLTTGWGWSGTILLSAVAVRTVTFALQALSSDKMAALAALKPLTEPIQKKMEEAIARGDKQQEHMLKMEQAMIMKPHMGGAFAMSGFMLVQMWIGFSVFRFLRALSALPAPGMSQDGFLWFLDLTVPDPYYILPVLTSGLMYSIVKLGGETGVQNDVATSKTRMNLMKYMSLAFGVVTAFQASALQLYFLANGLFGALTGYLLRQNWFRRAIHIRVLPSRASNELFTKVAEGQVKLSDIRDKTGKIRYQAPTVSSQAPRNTRSATTIAGLKLKPGTTVPRHMKPEEPKKVVGPKMHDDDFEAGAQGGILQRLDWVRRNYRPSYLMRRTSDRMENFARSKGYGGKKLTEQEEKRKRRAELYEAERKRRFEKR